MRHGPHKRIHRILKEHHPVAVKKARKIFSFRYPKLFLFVGLIILAYYIFTKPFVSGWIDFFVKLNNLGIFISGILIPFGFSAPFGIGLLTKMHPSSILIAAIIGGFGAMLGDLIIFKTIKFSFIDEFKRLERTKAIRKIEAIAKENKHVKVMHYLLYIFAGIVIASPLPDEIGVSMLAGLTTIKPLKLAVISFFVHTAAIFLIFYFSSF